jgi:hypothetical protein
VTETTELMAELESAHPGFWKLVEAERQRLYLEHPDPDERRRFLMSHLVRVETINGE